MKKYKRGAVIKSVAEFDKIVENEGFVYWRNFPRPKHFAWLQNMQYRVIRSLIKSGCFRKAIRIEK